MEVIVDQLHVETEVCDQVCEPSLHVRLAKADMLADRDAQLLAESFRILGDPTRIKILYALSKRELCVCDISAVLAIGQSAVSHQLRLLRGARLVKHRKEGKLVWYSLDDDHISQLLAQGIDHVKHGWRL